jgi:hypothetical protein
LLSREEVRSLYQQAAHETEFRRALLIKQVAREKDIDPALVRRSLNLHLIEQMSDRERGDMRHYHRTSLENFEHIVERGALMSRTLLEEEGLDAKKGPWSSRDDVMMTRDKFDQEGNLVKPGFSNVESVGGVGKEVMFVFKDNIIDAADYDTTGPYPTISYLPLSEYCEAILVRSDKDVQRVKDHLVQHGLELPVESMHSWQRT